MYLYVNQQHIGSYLSVPRVSSNQFSVLLSYATSRHLVLKVCMLPIVVVGGMDRLLASICIFHDPLRRFHPSILYRLPAYCSFSRITRVI